MKSLVILCTALSIYILSGTYGYAQEIQDRTQTQLEELNALKEKIVQEEKDALRIAIESINTRLQNDVITNAEAEILKKESAKKYALNIENRIAITENEMALMHRNGIDSTKTKRTNISISLGNDDVENQSVFGIQVNGESGKKVKYDRRTTSGAALAFGLNNVITEGESLEDSDFQIGGSRFFEIGWVWKTRVLNNSNWVRLKYGFSFQFNGLKPTENRYFVDTGEQTILETFPLDLKKAKLRMDNIVIPVHFEFGPSKKIEKDDYFRYDTDKKFKFGIGGYGGFQLGARQKLKFKENGENKKQKLKENYNTTNFVYGVSGYIGWGAGSIYAKYDLNPIFKDNAKDQRNISLGLRLDFD